MKSSRAMLLAAMLFVAPAFADQEGQVQGTKTEENAAPAETPATPAETPATPAETPAAPAQTPAAPAQTPANTTTTTEDKKAEDKKVEEAKKAEDKTTFERIREFAVAPFVFVLATAPDRIAQETLGRLAAIEYLKGTKVADFLSNKYTGRVAVGTVALVAAYKIYQATQDQDETDEDDVFGE